MNNKDNDIKKAIDEIFGDDVVEIDNDTKEEYKENNFIIEEVKEENNDIKQENIIDVSDSYTNLENKQEEIENNLNNKNDDELRKKILLYFLIGMVLGLILLYFVIKYFNNKEYLVNCSYEAEDFGYKITDEYKIKYKNNKILYVEGSYIYTVKTDDYKKQIEFIKKEKLPIIINSNGMKGFTYVYEESETFFKMQAYLDFSLFDYSKINKLDQKKIPISTFGIESNNYKKLKEKLEKTGYICTLSK